MIFSLQRLSPGLTFPQSCPLNLQEFREKAVRMADHFTMEASAAAAADAPPAEEEAGCYVPEFTLMGLNGFKAPWPPQCTYDPSTVDPNNTDPIDDPCWCIPDEGTDGCCPDPGERPVTYAWQVPEAFLTHVEVSEPIKLSPPGCNPFNEFFKRNNSYASEFMQNGSINGTCDKFEGSDNPEAVCAFIYDDEDEECGPQFRHYEMATYASYDEAIADGAVVTHHGGKSDKYKQLLKNNSRLFNANSYPC